MTAEQRIQDLASDSRAGRYARGEVRRHQREFVRRHWLMLLGTAAAVTAGTTLSALLAQGQFERGLVIGFGLAAAIAIDMHFVYVLTGSGPRSMGESAEQWTAQELRPLLDHGWRLINHVSLNDRGDMDHVLVGPGGLFVIETKWSATEWRIRPPDSMLAGAARSIEQRAGTLSRVVREEAMPLVVLWGRAASHLTEDPNPFAIPGYGAGVIAGLRVRDWALRQGRTKLTTEQIESAWAKLDKYASYTDAREDPVSQSVAAMSGHLVTAILVGLAAFVGIAKLFTLPHGWYIGVSVATLAIVASLALRTNPSTPAVARPALLAVVTSSAAALALWAAAEGWTTVT